MKKENFLKSYLIPPYKKTTTVDTLLQPSILFTYVYVYTYGLDCIVSPGTDMCKS